MGTKERREREKDATRDKIMSAARDLFAQEGYEAVSMRKIADAIEYSPTAIYVHFKDKEALLRELVATDFDTLAGVFTDLAKIADPIERIRQTGRAYVKFALAFPNHYRLMFMTNKAGKGESPCGLAEKGHGDPDRDAYAFVRHAVTQAIDAKRFIPGATDADEIACAVWAAVHGVASLHIVKSQDAWIEFPDIDRLTALAGDGILRGLLADPSELSIDLKKQPVAGPAKRRANHPNASVG